MSFRIIPCLLLSGKGLVKTRKFRDPVYIGDPINTARIFSDKEVDEMMLLDISATPERRDPDYNLIASIAGECFMPLSYGGGITHIDQVKKLIRSGIEKVVINAAAFQKNNLLEEAARLYGSQAVVGVMEVARRGDQYMVTSHSGQKVHSVSLQEHATSLEAAGCGEILVNNIDRDGTMDGYDLDLLQSVSSAVSIPIIACGGAGKVNHFVEAITAGGAAAVAGGSFFVFYGSRRAVLITYPREKLEEKEGIS